MTDPVRIRTQTRGEITEVRVQLIHPMESGQRNDPKTGQKLPAHFVRTFSISLNGKAVIQAQTGPSVSRNPVFTFRLNGVNAGDTITATWEDNRGESRSSSAIVGTAA